MRPALPLVLAALACNLPLYQPPAADSDSSTAPASTTAASPTSTSAAASSTTASSSTIASSSTGGASSTGTSTSTSSTTGLPGDSLGGDCDMWLQDCPSGQKCAPYSADLGTGWYDASRCIPLVPNPKQLDEPCKELGDHLSGEDDCDIGLMCWDLDENDEGTCHALCTGTPVDPECPLGTECWGSRSGSPAVCIGFCDPLAQDCENGELCIYNYENGGETWTCIHDASGDEGQIFDPCQYLNDCDAGNLCLNVTLSKECPQEAEGCCVPFCARDQGDAPCQALDPAMSCLPWYDESQMDPEKANIGICGVPQG